MIYPVSNKVFGFEDCHLYMFDDCALDGDPKSTWALHIWEQSPGIYIVPHTLPVPVHKGDFWAAEFEAPLYKDNKDSIKEGCKVWVHPSCSIPRTLLFSKYEKCLNPWSADVVVVPKCDTSGCTMKNFALFASDKVAVMVRLINNNERAESFKEGARFGDITKALDGIEVMDGIDALNNTEFAYVGDMLYVPTNTPILDALTNVFPTDKTVWEATIQASLADENNEITFDSLKSIHEMLRSTDENTVSASLKTLSMMDYMHYPESVKYVLNDCTNYYYHNKTLHATSVKFMFKQLYGTTNRRRIYGRYGKDIYKEDYELFRKIMAYLDNVDESSINQYICGYPFMRIAKDGILSPILKVA